MSVDYDALEPLDLNDAPLVIPSPGGKPVVLRPPHGVPRYTPPKIKQASLTPYVCPCARHLVLKPTHVKRKRMHPARSAAVKPATAIASSAPVHTIPRVASADVPARAPTPSPPPAQPKPAPAVTPVTKPVAAAPPAAPPAPPPAPPAKVATAAPAPAPAAPATAQWPNDSIGQVKPITPPAAPSAASNPQVLTPPPLAKPVEKPEVKTAAAPPPTVQPAETITAPAKPVEITKPSAEVAAVIPPAVKPMDAKIAVGEPTVVSYAGGGTAVPTESLPTVKDVSDRLAADPNLRVQLFSYASDPEKNVSRSRRLSLERAVAVRKLLIDNGLDSTRIEVRALGDQNNGGEADRVDIVLSARR
ncbi:MAG: hypothetical protein EPO08_15875 [Rhodospirillaceae bacterium]|nr:MAG: hypothetical protein EPO08_15875 [Rhodospirillaceae bacterium]